MEYREAEFVRFIANDETLADLLGRGEGGHLTKEREHAVLVVHSEVGHRFVLVRGGRDGIILNVDDDGKITIEAEGRSLEVHKLAWHVHPKPSGPSDHNRRLLDHLHQDSSMLYEIGGAGEGTRFHAMSRRRP